MVAISFLSCGGGKQDGHPPENPARAGAPSLHDECPSGTVLTYENFGEQFMLTYCTTCHSRTRYDEERAGAPAEINLDQPGDMAIWRIRMSTTLRQDASTVMPPSQVVPNADREMVLEWLGCGAPAEQSRFPGNNH